MIIPQNEHLADRLIRFILAELLFLLGYFWTGGMLQIILFIFGTILLLTSLSGFCPLYLAIKCNTKSKFPGTLSKKFFIPLVVIITILPFIGGYYSIFFTKKIFLEDFNRMNNYYKQTLFNTGQDKRAESIDNYEKLSSEYIRFSVKYTSFHPFVLKMDSKLNQDLTDVASIISGAKDRVYSGDLKALHTKLEEIRPVFQGILKRNNFSLLGVALVDFHDSMELAIEAADSKNAPEVIRVYSQIDEKLKAVEEQANDEEIKAIRANLESLLTLAREGKSDDLSKKAAELKSSFVKVYLKRG